jgi:hypothetical protein
MAKPKKAAKSEAVTAVEDNGASTDEINAIEDGKIFDYITGKHGRAVERIGEHSRVRQDEIVSASGTAQPVQADILIGVEIDPECGDERRMKAFCGEAVI